MTAGSQVAGTRSASFDDDMRARPRMVLANGRSESLFRGRALEIVCLAVALVLWGTSYKVSRFHLNPAAHTQLRVARCWLVPRTAEQTLAQVAHLQPAPAQGDHAAPVQSAWIDGPARWLAYTGTAAEPGLPWFGRRVSGRSPPFLSN